jgi:excisionase family DNA binding protein
MALEAQPDYLTVDEAAAYLRVSPGYLLRVLGEHGLTELILASMGKQILIRKDDLRRLRFSHRGLPRHRGAA